MWLVAVTACNAVVFAKDAFMLQRHRFWSTAC